MYADARAPYFGMKIMFNSKLIQTPIRAILLSNFMFPLAVSKVPYT